MGLCHCGSRLDLGGPAFGNVSFGVVRGLWPSLDLYFAAMASVLEASVEEVACGEVTWVSSAQVYTCSLALVTFVWWLRKLIS